MPRYPNPVKSKLPKVGTTIFTVMSALANEHGAINLSQGFPDFNCSPELVKLVNHHMKAGRNQYAPMQGIPALRKRISEKIEDAYSIAYDPDTEITVTAGATQAIYSAISAVVREGDEVIVFEPAYDCYVPAIELNGGIPVYIQLKPPHYNIDWNMVKKMISHRTRMIMINTPHNPTGTILTASDLVQLEKITKNTEILILSDEVYEHLIFDNVEHQSVCRFPKLAERSFVIYSFGKTYHTTGWKIGYCLAPANLMAEFRKVHQFQVFCANTPIQLALADFMAEKNEYKNLPKFFQKKRDLFLKLIKTSRFKAVPAAGSYFQLLDYSKISQEKDTDFAIRVTKEFGVASVPVSVFYHEPYDKRLLRFCFAKEDETLEKAAEKLCRI